MKFCTKCGAPIDGNIKFCSKCGNKLEQENISIDKEEKQETYNKESEKFNNLKSSSDELKKLNETTEIDLKEINKKYNKGNNDRQDNSKYKKVNKEIEQKKEKSAFGILSKVIIGVVLISILICGIFFNKIRGAYYTKKSTDAISENEKIDYAVKAVKVSDSEKTKELLKNTLIDMSKNDLDLAEEKLNQISNMLTQADIKSISIDIKNKKIDNLCKSSKYEEAILEFNELDKLGEDFKNNKNYDDVMLNVVSKLTGISVKSNKGMLMDNNAIYYENLDEDVFDEIIELKENDKYRQASEIKLNLYKCINGKYKLADVKIISNSYDKGLQGIYNYEKDVKGVFVHYLNIDNSYSTAVYGVDDGRLSLKGVVCGNDATKPDDVNNDGIYEILSNSKSYITSIPKETSKWYCIHSDGSKPSELNISANKANSAEVSSDYILPNSDKEYLTESQLSDYSKEKLALARNEIFARHGYSFKEEPFKSYFNKKNWYSINSDYDGSDTILNKYEMANYKLMQKLETK